PIGQRRDHRDERRAERGRDGGGTPTAGYRLGGAEPRGELVDREIAEPGRSRGHAPECMGPAASGGRGRPLAGPWPPWRRRSETCRVGPRARCRAAPV